MTFTPFARYRNFTLENLKHFLEIYPKEDTSMSLKEAIDYIKDGGENIPTEDGYTITASQLAERFLFDGKFYLYYYLLVIRGNKNEIIFTRSCVCSQRSFKAI